MATGYVIISALKLINLSEFNSCRAAIPLLPSTVPIPLFPFPLLPFHHCHSHCCHSTVAIPIVAIPLLPLHCCHSTVAIPIVAIPLLPFHCCHSTVTVPLLLFSWSRIFQVFTSNCCGKFKTPTHFWGPVICEVSAFGNTELTSEWEQSKSYLLSNWPLWALPKVCYLGGPVTILWFWLPPLGMQNLFLSTPDCIHQRVGFFFTPVVLRSVLGCGGR